MSAALFFVVLAGAVTIQAQRIEAQHRIDELDAALIAADEQHRVLRAEVAVAASPERVMEAARGLGLVEPGPVLPLVPPVTAAVPSAPEATAPPDSGSVTTGAPAGAAAPTGGVAPSGPDGEEIADGG